jgi:hypothetical protein
MCRASVVAQKHVTQMYVAQELGKVATVPMGVFFLTINETIDINT